MSAALDLLASFRMEDGRSWGQAAHPVQWQDAAAVLDEASPTPYHWLGRSRGYSKTTDLGAIALVVLLAQAPPRARLFGLAADQSQGGLLLDALGGFVSRTPELQGALRVQEHRVIAERSGATLTILPADAATVWGLRPYLLICDEVSQWHETPRTLRVWEGASSSLAKVPGSRLVVLGTAGDPSHFSFRIRNAALDDPLWRVHEVEGPPPWLDPARLAAEKRRLPESSYLRLFENQWTSGTDRLAAEEDIAACVVLDGPLAPQPGVRYVIGLDIGLRHDATVAAVCHAERMGGEYPRVVLDRMERWQGSRLRPVRLGTVEEWVTEASRRYNRARVRLDPWQGLHLAERLRRAGVSVQEFTFGSASVGRLATTLVELVREHALALPDDADLLDELRNVRLRESSPGVYRLDHDRNRHDDRAVAVSLAASHLVEKGASPSPARTWSAFREPRGRRHYADSRRLRRMFGDAFTPGVTRGPRA